MNVVFQKLKQAKKQKRYEEALKYAEELIPAVEQASGKNHPNVAVVCNEMASLCILLNDYARAVTFSQRALEINRKVLGPEHPAVVKSLNNLAQVYKSVKNFPQAVSYYQRALAISEKTLAPDHHYFLEIYFGMAWIHQSTGDYDKAEIYYKKILEIIEKRLGPQHPVVTGTLHKLAQVYDASGKYTQAESILKRALAINEKSLGPNHPKVGESLDRLGVVYKSLGRYTEAEKVLKRALAIKEKALGIDHPEVSATLNNLAVVYISLSDYTAAEAFLKRSIMIKKKRSGSKQADITAEINNMGTLYNALGDYAKAESFYKRSLAISQKNLGSNHRNVAVSLNNLAEMYHTTGNYTKAEVFYKKALKINKTRFGPEHPFVAETFYNLAEIYASQKDYFTLSEQLYKKALAIWERALGPDHPNVAMCHSSLAELYHSMGDYTKAKPLFERAIEIGEKRFGPENAGMARSYNGLAMLYETLEDYTRAEQLYKKALMIFKKAYGSDHVEVATILNNLGAFYAGMDSFKKAHDFHKHAQEIDSKLIDYVLGFTSEDRKIKFLSIKRAALFGYLSMIVQYLSQEPFAGKDALDVWLKRKGIILDSQKRLQEALVSSEDPGVLKPLQELSRVRTQLSKLAFASPGNEGPGVYSKRIAVLEKQKEELEAHLSRVSQNYALHQKKAKADCKKVAAALPDNTVLIEFANIQMFNFKKKESQQKWLAPHYLAFVLHAGRGDKVSLIDLGNANVIDTAIAVFKKELSDADNMAAYKTIEESQQLYSLIFEPLTKAIGNVSKIFISPDGNLNLIPFEVFQQPDGKCLIERYTFNYLPAGRDLLGFSRIKEQRLKALLMGDPDFDMGMEDKGPILKRLALNTTVEKDGTKRSADMKRLTFSRLPGTKEEINAIKAILGNDRTELYTGKNALEEVLRQKEAPGILHLATHGFFLSDLELNGFADTAMVRGISILPKQNGKKIKIENPLLRSGIALAGANHALRSKDGTKSDGIVTAEKILGLRLQGTDMVVLSACETGMGEVKTGEGVFGLRRAFTQAGAKSLVMSMWSVPDKETKELMVEFYKIIQSRKANRCQALRQAALKEMKLVKERYGCANPFYWGAFVFMGEP